MMALTSLLSRHHRRQDTYGWGDRRHSCLLLQLLFLVVTISCATANTKTKITLPSHSYSRIDDVMTDANHRNRYDDVTTRLTTNRVYGIPSSTFNNKEFRGGETSNNNYMQNVVNAGSNEIEHNAKLHHLSKMLSFMFLIIDQTINVSSAAFVASGYFGALVASWMIRKIHRALPILMTNSYIVGNNSGGTNGDAGWGIVGSLLGKYRLTSLATIGFVLLHTSGIQSQDETGFGQTSDAVFVIIMWYYSRGINPIIGGMIGCAHIALSIISMILGNRRLINSLDHLGDIRLERLGQYGNEEDIENDPYIDPIKYERVSKEPVIVAGESSNKITKIIAQVMDSASLLITFPQTFLGLYMYGMLNDMLLNDNDKSELLNCWELDTGFCLLKLSTRLVALHWIVAIIVKIPFFSYIIFDKIPKWMLSLIEMCWVLA